MIDLNTKITNVKGKAVSLVEPIEIPNGKPLSEEARVKIDEVVNEIKDEALKADVFSFFKDYVIKSELTTRDMCVRDVLQSLVSSIEKPAGKDMVRYTKLLPRLDDDCATLTLSEKETEWLVKRVLDVDEKIIGSVIKGRILNILDPDGELISKYGTDTE